MHRLFVAVRPPEPIRDVLIDTMDDGADFRWVGDEQLHLTFRLLPPIRKPPLASRRALRGSGVLSARLTEIPHQIRARFSGGMYIALSVVMLTAWSHASTLRSGPHTRTRPGLCGSVVTWL